VVGKANGLGESSVGLIGKDRFQLRGRMGVINVGIVNVDFFVMMVVMLGGRFLIGRVASFGMKRFGIFARK